MTANAPSVSFSSQVTATQHPLVAQYTITVPDGSAVKVQFGPTTSYGLQTNSTDAPSGGGAVSILVAGMTADSAYHLQALVTLGNGTTQADSDHVFQTGALPSSDLPKLQVTTNRAPAPGVELVNMNPGIPVVTDLSGNVLWFYLGDATDVANHGHPMPLRMLANGNIMALITNRYTGHPNTPYGCLREVDLSCTTVSNAYGPRSITLPELNQRLQQVPTPSGRIVQVNYFSHDVFELANGHVVVICQEFVDVTMDGATITVMGDALVDLDEAFNPQWVWSAFDHLDLTRHPYLWDPDHDWTHSNAVQATPDGNLMLSVRNQSWVLKINYANGAGDGSILWRLGYEGDFTLAGNAPANWFFAQHYPHILTTSGTSITSLTVVDNGNYRPGTDPPEFSRCLIVQLNEAAMTAEVAWQYPQSPDFYSYWGGDVVQLGNGDMEICMSRPTPQHSFAREVNFQSGTLQWEMLIAPPYAYRSYRMPSLYPGVQWP